MEKFIILTEKENKLLELLLNKFELSIEDLVSIKEVNKIKEQLNQQNEKIRILENLLVELQSNINNMLNSKLNELYNF